MADAFLVNISDIPLKECLSQRKKTVIPGTRFKVSNIISWWYTRYPAGRHTCSHA